MQPSLNVQTSYSLLSSIITFDDYFALAKEKKWKKLAICDNNMFGTFEFYKRCQKENIEPILGLKCDIWFEDELLSFNFFAKNLQGYFALVKISSFMLTNEKEKKFLTQFDKKDFLNLKIIVNFSQENQFSLYLDSLITFFDNNLFFGLNLDFDATELKSILQQKNYQKIIWNNETSYLHETDFFAFKILNTIKKQILFKDNLLTINKALFNNQKVLDNTVSITEFCQDIEIFNLENYDFQANLFHYPIPYNLPADKYLLSLCQKKLTEQNFTPEVKEIYKKRLKYELEIINKMGFNNYFLIVWDYVAFAKKNNIFVGPGRGSAAGSLVSYLLEITCVDPVANNLLFERFLNPERNGMPDIDIDFQDNRRDEIVEYLFEKYGSDHVSYIVTFQTIGFKMAIRDLGRIFELPLDEVNKMSKLISFEDNFNFFQALENNKILQFYLDKYPIIFENLPKIIGLPRQTGTHAAGVVLSNKPLINLVPIKDGYNGIFQTQYSMNYLEDIGLLKMDILGLRTLTILHDIVDNISNDFNYPFQLEKIPLDDVKTFQMLSKGETKGIFQLESGGMTQVLIAMKPNKLEDIIATSSLYRPGPQENIPTFIRRKLHQEKITYLDERLKDILAPTYGIIVYQEQVMLIAQKVANFSLSKADILRRAMGKKDIKIMKTMHNDFIQQAIANNYSVEKAKAIWELIYKFAAYGFNRSHAYAYSLLGYQMAYLKANYPSAFLASLLSNVIGDENKTAEYLNLTHKFNLTINLPNINNPIAKYQTIHEQILLPLLIIKQIGYNFFQNIYKDFQQNGKYYSIYDVFIRLWKKGLNKKTYEALCFAGALDDFKISRTSLYSNYQLLENYANLIVTDNNEEQNDNVNQQVRLGKPELQNEERDLNLEINKEKEFLGFYLSIHPIKIIREQENLSSSVTLIQNLNLSNKTANILVKILHVKKILDKNKKAMAFLDCYDDTGEISLTVFASIFESKVDVFQKDNTLLINITLQKYKDKISGIVNKIKLLKIEEKK